jgi:hypothetical protein
MLAILHLKPQKPGRSPLLSLASHSKTEPSSKEKPVDPFRSRHTRMPSSRHVGGYLCVVMIVVKKVVVIVEAGG